MARMIRERRVSLMTAGPRTLVAWLGDEHLLKSLKLLDALARAHGDAHIGRAQGRGVVDAVARDGDDVASSSAAGISSAAAAGPPPLEGGDQQSLVRRLDARQNGDSSGGLLGLVRG